MSNSLFFFNHPATTEIYTLSLHDALPIYGRRVRGSGVTRRRAAELWESTRPGSLPQPLVLTSGRDPLGPQFGGAPSRDRKSTRLNSSHVEISYAVFCLKKKKKN